MSRSKQWRWDWSFFLGGNGKRQYNWLCKTCAHSCKQSFRVDLVFCPRYLSRRFRDIMGFSFIECLTASRIRHACVLLTESDMSVREVALSVGYQDSLYFSKVFKKKMAVSPARYRVEEAARKKWADGKKG